MMRPPLIRTDIASPFDEVLRVVYELTRLRAAVRPTGAGPARDRARSPAAAARGPGSNRGSSRGRGRPDRGGDAGLRAHSCRLDPPFPCSPVPIPGLESSHSFEGYADEADLAQSQRKPIDSASCFASS